MLFERDYIDPLDSINCIEQKSKKPSNLNEKELEHYRKLERMGKSTYDKKWRYTRIRYSLEDAAILARCSKTWLREIYLEIGMFEKMHIKKNPNPKIPNRKIITIDFRGICLIRKAIRDFYHDRHNINFKDSSENRLIED